MKTFLLFLTCLILLNTRQSQAQGTRQITAADLIGSWYCSDYSYSLEYRTGEVAIWNGIELKYSLIGNNIIQYTSSNDYKVAYKMNLNGNTLTFINEQGTFIYKKVSGGQSEKAQSTGRTDGREIAGEWVYSDISSGQAGSGNYIQRLILKKDGTFTYSESNEMSGHSYDDALNAFLSGRDGSNGTWSYNGTYIFFNGQSYTCTKGYTKNTHEPALIIGGRLFYTGENGRADW